MRAEPRSGRRPTIADIAARAGVSKGAVSYAVNNRGGIAPATRERILHVAEELGWRPNSAAKALSASRSGACGLVINRPARTLALEPFFMELISGIELGLSRRSVALMLQVVDSVDAEMAALQRWWGERRVDGVLVVDLRIEDPRVRFLEETGMPAVVIGGPGHTGSLPAVWTDDSSMMRTVVKYLAAIGHRRIARVAGVEYFLHTAVRTQAFVEAASAGGLQTATVTTDYSPEEGARATRELLTDSRPPTAIVFDNDIMALAGLAVMGEMGVDVPGEVSIVAWDDTPLAQLVHPALTALTKDVAGFGAFATEQLLRRIAGEDPGDCEGCVAHLTPRASTAGPKVRESSW